jgi:hypothetical protein
MEEPGADRVHDIIGEFPVRFKNSFPVSFQPDEALTMPTFLGQWPNV